MKNRRRDLEPSSDGRDLRSWSLPALALNQRRRLSGLLYQRLRLVRSAARVVFRHHPATAREVTSAYEQRCRASAKRKAAVAEAAIVKAATSATTS